MNDDEYRNPDIGRVAAEIEQAGQNARKFRRKDYWTPYPKQAAFIALSKRCRETALFAGNQLGKSDTRAFALATHLLGDYGQDWPGRVFNRPITALAASENLKMSRDILQTKLCGKPGQLGSGMLPKDSIISTAAARGEQDALDSIQVKHRHGISTCLFRTYNAGREALQGLTIDVGLLDEECDFDIYMEILARITATRGMLALTDRGFVTMGLADVPDDGHISPADRASIIEGYAPHQRDARVKGEPMLARARFTNARKKTSSKTTWQCTHCQSIGE
jgi:phage terminase large subunit-like protein